MKEKVQNIDGSSNTNYVDAFMKISDTQEQIKLTVLFVFFCQKTTNKNDVLQKGTIWGGYTKKCQLYLHI